MSSRRTSGATSAPGRAGDGRRPFAHHSSATPSEKDRAREPRCSSPQGTALMPPRTHLNKNDVDQLIAYLTQAIGKPVDAPRAQRVSSWARLGEHVVKGTCHICHDAVGRTPGRPGLPETDIPLLESLLARKSVAEFVRKARGDVTVAARERALSAWPHAWVRLPSR